MEFFTLFQSGKRKTKIKIYLSKLDFSIIMKRAVWTLIILIAVISAYAAYFPQQGTIFAIKGAKCYSSGAIIINMTHEGNILYFNQLNLTIENNELGSLPFIGIWLRNGDLLSNYDYPLNITTGNSFEEKTRFKFKTTHNIFTKGVYSIRLAWPSYIDHFDKVGIEVECPGINCSSDDSCISEQKCVNSICEWVRCDENKLASGHGCLPKCNDYDSSTEDIFSNGECAYQKITKQKLPDAVKENIFARFWNWLKSKY